MNFPCNFTKKFFVQVICYQHLKNFHDKACSRQKRSKQKIALLLGSNIFFLLLLLEIEAEELVGKKQSSTTRALCDNNRNMLCFQVIHKIEQLQYYNRNFKTCCPSRMSKSVMHGDQTSCSFSRCVVLKEKAHPFFINLIDSCLILFCLLFTAKNVYN